MFKPFTKLSAAHKLIVCAFACAGIAFLLVFGFYLGIQFSGVNTLDAGSFSANSFGENVATVEAGSHFFDTARRIPLFVSAGVTLLLGWTAFLLFKSLRSQKFVERSNQALKEEIQKREKVNADLKAIHKQLASASGQLGGLLEGSNDLIVAIDCKYDFISFNRSYSRVMNTLFGVDIEVGQNVLVIQENFPEMRSRSKELWDRAFTGERFTAEQVVENEIGETVYYELSYNPIKNTEDEIIGACQITRDATERVLTSATLKQERDFVSAAFDVSSSLVFVLDREGRIIRFNRASEDVSGFKAEEVKGRIFWNVLLAAEDIKQTKSRIRNIGTDNDNGEEWVNQWITKDEKLKLISWKATCIYDDNDGIEYIVATGIDITEKTEFETARNRMLAILENSDDFISISDIQGQIVYLNRAGRFLLGLTPDSDISQLRLQSCHPDWAREIIQTEGIPSAVKYGSWLGNTALRTVDKVEIPTSHMILSHKTPDGRLEYISTVARNRTSEQLLEEELAEARDTAINTTNLKSEFLANMSHEIRTPMNGIIGISELLSGTSLDEEQQDYVTSIAKSGEALLTIVNDILDFSKIEAGKLEFENKLFDLRETSESVLDLFAHLAFQKEVELSLVIRKETPLEIKGDAGRLRQVLTNLVGNAVKFTKQGEVAVRITVDDQKLKFSVRDTGIGIPAEDQSVLFTAFGQAESSIAGKFGGTGLGLAISKQLVTLMGGEIGFNSEAGKGSEFFFSIPLLASASSGKIYPDLRGTGLERVLVVNSNPTVRALLVYQLKAMGLSAEEAVSAKTGMEILQTAAELNEPFDGVIADIDLPRQSGLEMAEAMTKDPKLRVTKTILLVNADDRANYGMAKRIGVERFIFKPIKTSQIIKAITGKTSGPDGPTGGAGATPRHKRLKPATKSITPNMNNNQTRILIAEDNLVNQKVILSQVSRLGFNVDLVENGQEVLDALALKQYSMILMDCQMPVMDGFEATARIRKDEETSGERIPIIAVTAHAISGDRERCISHGMDDYISKPTDQETLREILSRWSNEAPVVIPATIADAEPMTANRILGGISEEEKIAIRLSELSDVCGSEVVDECIDLFIVDTAAAIDNLERAFEEANIDNLVREAHKLKGSAANMGATRLPKICQTIMEIAENGQVTKIGVLLKQVRGEHRFLGPVYERIRTPKEISVNKDLPELVSQ